MIASRSFHLAKIHASDAERVAFLFELYHKYTSLLPGPEKAKKRRGKKEG